MRSKIKKSTISRSLSILSREEKFRVIFVLLLQITFGVLDLIGVALVGLVGTLAVNGVASQEPGNRVSTVLKLTHLNNSNLQTQVTVLGLSAALILIAKTIFSIYFSRKILFFLSRRAAKISGILISRLLSNSLTTVQSKSTNELVYSLTSGVSTITVGVIGTSVSVLADFSLLFVLAVGLLFVDTIMAISTFVIFAIIALILYRLMNVRARRLGIVAADLSIKSNEKIMEVITSYREAIVRNRREFYSRTIKNDRMLLADTNAEMTFMPQISKYVIEITVVLSAIVISAIQFHLSNASHAVGVLSVFMAASLRISPAVLRLQQGAVSIKASIGAANPTLELIELIGNQELMDSVEDKVQTIHDGFSPQIDVEAIEFSYPESNKPVISGLSFQIQPGSVVAIVGPSGAGKTTLVDLILGVLVPSSGKILISGKVPLEAIKVWPGAIGYVPQDVIITNSTIKENVAMGFPAESIDVQLVSDAILIAQLQEFVNKIPQGIETRVSDRGTRLSGGQRQRLGIARAMFTKPRLLVLDEATSSLDGETESNISEAVQRMRGQVTVVMIAHRLSTVRNADKVIYLREGKIEAQGNFEEVRNAIPDFDKQAKLMGL